MGGNQSRDGSIDNDQNLEEVLEVKTECCIYRVPPFLIGQNEEIYIPKLISIGPLHYGRANLMGMEKQKTKFMSSFEGRVGAQKLEEFKTYLRNQKELIGNHYSVTSNLPIEKFFSIILRDSVFIVELLLRCTIGPPGFLLTNDQLRSKLLTDLFLIENQIPFFVLDWLHSSAFPISEGYPFFIHDCYTHFSRMKLGYALQPPPHLQIKHFTDLMRNFLILEDDIAGLPPVAQQTFDIPSATKLYASGLEFTAVRGKWTNVILGKRRSGCLPWLEVTELQIPCISLSPYPTDTKMCHFARLMDRLIDTTEDVELLVEKDIIINNLGDAESVAKIFNGICKDILLPVSPYADIIKQMNGHYRQPWNRWKGTLKRIYFSDIWTGTATFAAVFLLILTIVQAVCSILQRKLDKCFGFSTDELPHDSLVQLVDGCREHTRKLVEKNIIVALNTLKSRTRAAYAHCYPALMLFI
ncbi:hypothetical protein LWI29_003742 [Acer saccharum]|uniref:Uncharacterized protein n=1 Tax=Acer saccharum TaxID=4024 RepID=A0AA39W832_ACESA|nr:hypothetical protein LWI29_003742 [Acer saccharum]